MDDKGRILETEMQARAGIGLGAFMEKKTSRYEREESEYCTCTVSELGKFGK